MSEATAMPVLDLHVRASAPGVRVDQRPAPRRVIAVVPCFNRPEDAACILHDLSHARLAWSGGRVDLHVILVDNASDTPLSALPAPAGLSLEHVRLARNSGGSGGYSAGLAHALSAIADSEDHHTYLWLVDSDARVMPDTLGALVGVLERDPRAVAAGAALADPDTRQVFEVGGRIDRRTGVLRACMPGRVGVRDVVPCDYVASCCALVRASAARVAGAFPDRFLNADDAEWFVRMAQQTRGRIVGVPWAVALHPRFDRFPTWTRYYATRNALGPLQALGLGPRARLCRALADAARVLQHALAGRRDLARMHLTGLRDLAAGRTTGPAPEGSIAVERPIALDALPLDLAACLDAPLDPPSRVVILDGAALCVRLVMGPSLACALIPSRPGLRHLARAQTQVQREAGGYVISASRGLPDALAAAWMGMRAAALAVRGALRPGPGPSPTSPEFLERRALARRLHVAHRLDVVVLAYNRRDTLLRTLRALHADSFLAAGLASGSCLITVVDNASADATPHAVAAEFPGVRLIAQNQNTGVDAFNVGVSAGRGDIVLILDDDAVPAPGAIGAAVLALADNPTLGAVALHPRHPSSGLSEWSFTHDSDPPCDACPVMGCANLVRRSAWEQARGYEPAYFLYRNDMDLALKLLSLGWGVRLDPALVVWHDSPAGPGAPKSLHWHRRATRNWVWTARRHGRGSPKVLGILLGWLWTHKAAGADLAKHRSTLRGFLEGLRSKPPAFEHADSDGRAWRSYLVLRLLGRVR